MSNGEIEQKPAWRLWFLAALAALALHLGGAALAVTSLKSNDGDDGLGANGAEFAVEMESPNLPDDELPVGPDQDALQASQEQVEQKAELKQADLPVEKPNESDDPDRIVTENNSKTPQEDDPKVAAVQTEAAPEQQYQEAKAPQQLEDKTRESNVAKAPNAGIGKDRSKLTADWGRKISAYFELHKRYPQDRAKAALVKVSLVLNRLGKVLSVDVVQSSGDVAFDDAAVSMIRRSDPVPAPPASLTDDQFSFSLNVQFKKPK